MEVFCFGFFGNFLNLYVFWGKRRRFLGHIHSHDLNWQPHQLGDAISRCFASLKRLEWKTNKRSWAKWHTPRSTEITEGETGALVLGQLIGQGNYVLMLLWLHLYPLTGEAGKISNMFVSILDTNIYLSFHKIQFVWKLRCCTLALGLFWVNITLLADKIILFCFISTVSAYLHSMSFSKIWWEGLFYLLCQNGVCRKWYPLKGDRLKRSKTWSTCNLYS